MTDISIPDKFFKPFYKLHLASLLESVQVSEGWSVKVQGGEERLVCCMVWLQAEVACVNLEEGWVELEEEGSRLRVVNIKESPGGVEWLQPGQYVQVLGQLINYNNRVYCCKIINLLEDNKISKSNCQKLWDLEVAEIHQVLTEKLKISEQ